MTLDEHLAAVRANRSIVPTVTLDDQAAFTQALVLRQHGLTYPAIATAMALYHGDERTPDAWRGALRLRGAGAKHYRESLRVPPTSRNGGRQRRPSNPVLARRLRSCRQRAGLSQRELAALIRMNQASVSEWENGAHVPASRVVTVLAETFGVSVEFLTGSEIT